MKRALLASLFLVFLCSATYAEYEVTEGYDENTEITVKGIVKELLRGVRGPVIIVLQSGSRDYKVISAPPWYLAQQGVELATGSSFEITGSKYIGRDGNIYIVASRLKDLSTGKTTLLRDSSCRPFWRGHRMMMGPNPAQ